MTLFAPGIVHAQQPPASGGGGGGGPVLIDSALVTVAVPTVTLSGITDEIGSLVLEGRCRHTQASGVNGRPVGLELNALGSGPTINWSIFRSGHLSGADFTSIQVSQSWPVNIAIMPGSDADTQHWASFTHRFTFPRQTTTIGAFDDLYHHMHGKSGYTISDNLVQMEHFAIWGVFPHEPIDSLKLYAYEGISNFAVGSRFSLWGYPST